ncbi:hypothetical protein M413DRAFT_13184 [Hebeloma cylindrosporum]|uniref:Uncharacterized protein n=1 Tax=Hebeloma cylindrosporum TaxID=76867 RepID=A0A0C3C2B0_HEBCY|nr:hypothetical protein M413DRAFT_13184 [Hebeloma cylindrosporum h7]
MVVALGWERKQDRPIRFRVDVTAVANNVELKDRRFGGSMWMGRGGQEITRGFEEVMRILKLETEELEGRVLALCYCLKLLDAVSGRTSPPRTATRRGSGHGCAEEKKLERKVGRLERVKEGAKHAEKRNPFIITI